MLHTTSLTVHFPAVKHWTDEEVQGLSKFISYSDLAKKISIHYPPTNAIIANLPCSQAEQIQLEAKISLNNAFKSWSETPISQRTKIFIRFHDLVLQNRDKLLDLIQLETGKARANALEEVLETAINSRYYANRAKKWLKEVHAKGAIPFLTKTQVQWVPVGIIGIISPWNYPFALPIADAIPALLAGNSVLIKPSELTPLSCLFGKKLLIEAGLPPDVLQIIHGTGPDLGPELIELADSIAFTGSTHTGRIIAEHASKQLKKVSLELGGKNPLIALKDAPIEKLTQGIISGSFANSGQLCVSIEKVYIHEKIYDQVKSALVEKLQNLKPSANFDAESFMGSLVSKKHCQKVADHIQDAVDKGAKVLSGGLEASDLERCMIAPTVLEGVSKNMLLSEQETFGPVIALYPFSHVDDLIEELNQSIYGLNASVWSTNTTEAHRVARKLRFGTVNINEGYAAAYGSVDAPMGGMRCSGLGRRHAKEGFFKYLEPMTIAHQRGMPVGPNKWVSGQQYIDLMSKAIQLMKYLPGLK